MAGILSVKLGWVVTTSCVLTALVSAVGASSSSWTTESSIQQLLWLLPVVVSAFCGIALMRASRFSTKIEVELLRADKTGSWDAARPLVSSSPIAMAWNALLEQASGRAEVPSQTSRDTAPQESSTYLARAIRSLPIGLVITDAAGSIRIANYPFAALMGKENLKDLEGQSVESVLDLDASSDAERIRERIQTAARTISFQLNRGEETVDGVYRVTRNRLAGRDGDADGYVWLVQDITQHVIASDARDQFLNTASHELRMPLANLKAYAEALSIENGIDVEQQKEFCNIINSESTRLSRLVDELLAVGQMEAGSMVLNRSDIDFSRVLNEAIDHIRPYAEKKQQRVELQLAAKLPTVNCDKDKIQAAVVNVIGNAVKYTMDKGEIRIRASADNGILTVEVHDTGVGIPESDIERVFEKFYRANDERVSDENGNGLGLAFAREIVRRHSGDIIVESELNVGSVFSITLPANEKDIQGS